MVVAGLTSPSLSWEFTAAASGFRDGFTRKQGFPGGSDGKDSACNARNLGLIPGSGRSQLPTPVCWPGGFHGQRSLVWATAHGVTEEDMTERLTFSLSDEAEPQSSPPFATVGIQASLFSEHFFLFTSPLSTQCPSSPHVTLNAEASGKINQRGLS